MKKSSHSFALFLLVFVLLSGGAYAYQNGEVLQGVFHGSFLSSSCGVSKTKTIYVKAGAGAGGTGTKAKPYDSIASAQAALESDSKIGRVCFSGELDGTLDLDAALTPDLTLTAYGTSGNLAAEGTVIELHGDAGVMQNLTIQNLRLDGSLLLAPAVSLSIKNVTADGGGNASGLWLGSADAVTIASSSFDDSNDVIYTNPIAADAVGSLTLDDVDISAYRLSLTANTLNTLTVTKSRLSYGYRGIYLSKVANALVEKSTLDGENVGSTGLFIKDDAVLVTHLDFENNFVLNNTTYALYGVGAVSPANIVANIFNNSFFNNAIIFGVSGVVTIQDNIIYTNSSGWAFTKVTPPGTLTSDYNLFYGGDTSVWTESLSEWQSYSGLDSNSISGDPLFVSAGDLHLSAGSPAIDAGMDTGVSEDIDGDARPLGTDFDIGADEEE